MSKVYQALVHAEAERKMTRKEKPGLSMQAGMAWRSGSPNIEGLEKIDDLCQRIDSLLPAPGGRIIQFIGSRKGEGTSTVVNHFAGSYALKTRKSVLVLDADRIDPVQHTLFDVQPERCLHEVVRDGSPVESACCRVGGPKLSVCLVSGNSVFPAQILNNGALWDNFRSRFDLVVVDAPPIEESSDGLALVRHVDGVVFVIEAEKTRWPVARRSRDSIIDSGGKILGVVFNKRRHHIPGWIYRWL